MKHLLFFILCLLPYVSYGRNSIKDFVIETKAKLGYYHEELGGYMSIDDEYEPIKFILHFENGKVSLYDCHNNSSERNFIASCSECAFYNWNIFFSYAKIGINTSAINPNKSLSSFRDIDEDEFAISEGELIFKADDLDLNETLYSYLFEPKDRDKIKKTLTGIVDYIKKENALKYVSGYSEEAKMKTTPSSSRTPTTPAKNASTPSSHSSSDGLNFTVNGVSFSMVSVEGGTFSMGNNSSYLYERPVHKVTVDKFRIGKYEVTQALWEAVMGNNPSHFKGKNLPVESVSWNDCQSFIAKLNQLTGQQFRFPTEAEWEYAARGGKKSRGNIYSGSNNVNDVAWYESKGGRTTHPVGTKSANELGIYDMTGNVNEWCSDWYDSDYYKNSPQNNPKGLPSGYVRAYRGGSWFDYDFRIRVFNRNSSEPSRRDITRGLRLAL